MRFLLLLFPIALCACMNGSPDGAVPATPAALAMTGLGPVHIGMSVPEAEHALATTFAPMTPGEEEACWQTRRADGNDPQVWYMVENGKITRIDIEDTSGNATQGFGNLPAPSAIKTVEGIGFGAAEADVIAAYGPATEVLPHKYDEQGRYLVVQSADGRSALLFETQKGRVTIFRAGVHPSVDYVEGCS